MRGLPGGEKAINKFQLNSRFSIFANALADNLGASVNIGRDTFAYIQEAIDQGRAEDDFTRLHPDLEKLDTKK